MEVVEIKDNPNIVKDVESGAILVKKDNSPTAIRLQMLTKRVNKLEQQVKELYNIINDKSV